MNRKIIFALLPALAFSQIASAQLLSPLMKDFSAPIIKDRTLLPGDVPFGSIVYDTTAGNFFGLSNTGVWKNLSSAGGGAGANTALSNLASTAINADLLPATTNTINLGSTSGLQFANISGQCGHFSGTSAKIGDCGTAGVSLTLTKDSRINGITVGLGTNSIATNVAVGKEALLSNDTGYENAAVGNLALKLNTFGYGNVAVGSKSLSNNLTAYYNVAVGSESMLTNVYGSSNTAVGNETLKVNYNGHDNIAIGARAMRDNIDGVANTALGRDALITNRYGSRNIAIGTNSLQYYNPSSVDGYNTVVGYASGDGIVSGVRNTIIGSQVVGLDSNLSNNVIIADGSGVQRIRVLADGNMGIGTQTPTSKLQVAGQITPSEDDTYPLGDSSLRFTEVYATNGTINTSDVRMKKEIQDSDLGLSFIEKLRPVSYRWKNGTNTNLHYGLIAQETEKAIQDAKNSSKEEIIVVRSAKNGAYGLNYSELISPIIKAVQELSGDQKSVKAEMASLKAENAELKSRLEKLEKAIQAK